MQMYSDLKNKDSRLSKAVMRVAPEPVRKFITREVNNTRRVAALATRAVAAYGWRPKILTTKMAYGCYDFVIQTGVESWQYEIRNGGK